ncbi:hypothetical protein IQ06DRAFT_347872 [Phaeosphaeriaceae sp. SRC1lsM3a]|nr:hypothetical protein IQ06DRAFT_347872 [Stagonospora sp. SRC1lsM3a]
MKLITTILALTALFVASSFAKCDSRDLRCSKEDERSCRDDSLWRCRDSCMEKLADCMCRSDPVPHCYGDWKDEI